MSQIQGAVSNPTDALEPVVVAAFDLGWSLAVLYGRLNPAQSEASPTTLWTENELPGPKRSELELVRIGCLLPKLRTCAGLESSRLDDAYTALRTSADQTLQFRAALADFDVAVLESLSCCGHEAALAFQLGRSLRDTANPPTEGGGESRPVTWVAIVTQFNHRRISKIRQWLQVLAPHFPSDSALAVSGSLGKWRAWTSVAIDTSPDRVETNGPRTSAITEQEISEYLLDQGDVWRDLLTGVLSTDGLLSPEANVAAGEDALNRTAKIIRRTALHYWFVILLMIGLLGGVLYTSIAFLGGAARVWTQIAAFASSLGISFQRFGAALSHMTEVGERPIYRAAKADALAWALTTLPKAPLGSRQRRRLRRAGIQRPRSLVGEG